MFYSLPPAGNRIPLTILGAIHRLMREDPETFLNPIKEYLGGNNLLLYLSSGRAALWLILKTFSSFFPEKNEVIIPAYSCPAVASAILKVGLKPVLCDINLDNFGFSMEDLEKKITTKILAVVIVHLFGFPANIGETRQICVQKKVVMVEDAAQGFGNTLFNESETKLGLVGDAGFYSFGRGKPLSLLHGGLALFNSPDIFNKALEMYKNLNPFNGFKNIKLALTLGGYAILSNPYFYWLPEILPFLHLGETVFEEEINPFQGSSLSKILIISLLDSLDKEKKIRGNNSEWYAENISRISGIKPAPSTKFPYLRYPLLLPNKHMRDRQLASLKASGTGAALFYPCPLNALPGLKEILKDGNEYPNAQRLADSLITLPVHSGVTPKIRENIFSILRDF